MAFLTSWTHKLNSNPSNPSDPIPTNNPTLPSYQPVATHYVPPPKPKIPPRPNEWPIPTLRIRVDDLNHPGAQLFFKHINPYEALKDACISSFVWLYTLETVPRQCVSPTSSVPDYNMLMRMSVWKSYNSFYVPCQA